MRLAEHLQAARRRQFVGREQERALVRSVLAAETFPFYVLHVFGPGGVGKSSLLQEFVALAHAQGVTPVYLDVRNLGNSPDSFITALQGVMGLELDEDPCEVIAARAERHMLLLDTYEQFELDAWLRESFLPQLPEHIFVVLAGRNPPTTPWRTDPGWNSLLRLLPLRNLSEAESRSYLDQRHVPTAQQAAVLTFTHGHPLALSLVADVFDQRPDLTFQPDETPDVISTLLGRFVQKVLDHDQRLALELCGLARLTTEALLLEVFRELEPEPPTEKAVRDVFEWLRGLSFIDTGRTGVFPHDLVRDSLTADLRWRNPDRYAELHRSARRYYAKRLGETAGREQRRILLDYNFLHRDNPTWKPFFDWQESSGVWTDTLGRPQDIPALVAMVAHHEGDESARHAERWLNRLPHSTLVFRDGEPTPAGFLLLIHLNEVPPEELEADPGTRAVWHYLQSHAPLRPGERATILRFWMARDGYQGVSAAQTRVFLNVAQYYLTTPNLAFTFSPCANPMFWMPAFLYMDFALLHEAAFEVGGRSYGVFGHDWRAVPAATWLDLLAEREMGMTQEDLSPPPTIEHVIVLDQSSFAQAVRDALRDYPRPDILAHSPLLRSRLVIEECGTASDEARVEYLQHLLDETIDNLQQTPRDMKGYRALYHTYLHPAPTQEQVAEMLDLPFSTYRRHLKQGIERLTDLLWQREVNGEG